MHYSMIILTHTVELAPPKGHTPWPGSSNYCSPGLVGDAMGECVCEKEAHMFFWCLFKSLLNMALSPLHCGFWAGKRIFFQILLYDHLDNKSFGETVGIILFLCLLNGSHIILPSTVDCSNLAHKLSLSPPSRTDKFWSIQLSNHDWCCSNDLEIKWY